MNHPDNPLEDWKPRKSDLNLAFKTIKNEILNPSQYKGQYFDKAIGGFSFRGKTYSTLQEIYSAIDLFLDKGDRF